MPKKKHSREATILKARSAIIQSRSDYLQARSAYYAPKAPVVGAEGAWCREKNTVAKRLLQARSAYYAPKAPVVGAEGACYAPKAPRKCYRRHKNMYTVCPQKNTVAKRLFCRREAPVSTVSTVAKRLRFRCRFFSSNSISRRRRRKNMYTVCQKKNSREATICRREAPATRA